MWAKYAHGIPPGIPGAGYIFKKGVGTGQLGLKAAHRRAQLDQRGRTSRDLLEQLKGIHQSNHRYQNSSSWAKCYSYLLEHPQERSSIMLVITFTSALG